MINLQHVRDYFCCHNEVCISAEQWELNASVCVFLCMLSVPFCVIHCHTQLPLLTLTQTHTHARTLSPRRSSPEVKVILQSWVWLWIGVEKVKPTQGLPSCLSSGCRYIMQGFAVITSWLWLFCSPELILLWWGGQMLTVVTCDLSLCFQ